MAPSLWVFAPWRTVVRSEVKLFVRFQTGVATCIMLWIALGGDIHTGLGPGFVAKWGSQANERFLAAACVSTGGPAGDGPWSCPAHTADPPPATAAAAVFNEWGGKSVHMSQCSRCLAYLCQVSTVSLLLVCLVKGYSLSNIICIRYTTILPTHTHSFSEPRTPPWQTFNQAMVLEVCLFEDFFSHLLRTVWLSTLGYYASHRHGYYAPVCNLSHDVAACGTSLPILVGGVSLLFMAVKVLYFRGPRRAFRFPRTSNYFNFELGMLPMLTQLPEIIPLLMYFPSIFIPEGAAQAAESAIYASVLQMLGATPTDAVADLGDGPLLEEATASSVDSVAGVPYHQMVPITVAAIIIYGSSYAFQCVQDTGHKNPERVPWRDGETVLLNDDKPSWRLQRHETMVKLTRIVVPLGAVVSTLWFNQQAQTALIEGTRARATQQHARRERIR